MKLEAVKNSNLKVGKVYKTVMGRKQEKRKRKKGFTRVNALHVKYYDSNILIIKRILCY